MSPDGTEQWLNWIIRRNDRREPLGYTQATVRNDKALIAYVVFSEHWRAGIATAAVELMLYRLAADYGVHSFSALVDTRNLASCAVLKKLGFAVSRRIDLADHFKGERSDEFEFALNIAEAPTPSIGG